MSKIEFLEKELDGQKKSYDELLSKYASFKSKHRDTVQYLEEKLNEGKKEESNDLLGIMKSCRNIF